MNANVTIDRHKYIGGSDIPIIMGISPFKSRFDLLLEKAELKDNDFEGNEYTEYGNVLEPKIRDYINTDLYDPYYEDTITDGNIRGNFDGINETGILEIKTTSQVKKTIRGYKVYLVQLLFYMQLSNRDLGMLAVYERPTDFSEEFSPERLTTFMVDIEDYKDLLLDINSAVDKFNADLLKVKANPLITEEDLQGNELIELSNKVLALEEQLKDYKVIEDEYRTLKKNLQVAMENEGIKKWTTNNGVQITLVPNGEDSTVSKFDEKTFKEENEELYNKYLIDVTKKGRAGYVKITLPKE